MFGAAKKRNTRPRGRKNKRCAPGFSLGIARFMTVRPTRFCGSLALFLTFHPLTNFISGSYISLVWYDVEHDISRSPFSKDLARPWKRTTSVSLAAPPRSLFSIFPLTPSSPRLSTVFILPSGWPSIFQSAGRRVPYR